MRKDVDDNDAYIPSVKPLDMTLYRPPPKQFDTNIDGDAYQLSVKPLNITLRRLLIDQYTDDHDAYKPSVKPLDITLKAGA